MAKNWIAGAIRRPGALHSQLGIPQGQKIPPATLNAAAQAGGTLGRRARLAKTLSGFAEGGMVGGSGEPSSTAAHIPDGSVAGAEARGHDLSQRAVARFKRACHGN